MANKSPADAPQLGKPETVLSQEVARESKPAGETGAVLEIPDHELLRCIGRGSYGEVWLARNVLGQFRAVKVVYRKNFEHERPYDREFEGIQNFEPISRLHDSQVDILHVGRNEKEGYFYYVMELADDANPQCGVRKAECGIGEAESSRSASFSNPQSTIRHPQSYVPHTLKLDVYRRGQLSVDECISIGLALTTALEHLHSHGLVHRDVKPSNIIFISGMPKLADIGLVTNADATMTFVGTSGFLPPEGPSTPQGDLYSLGKVLYEISMGRDRTEFPKLPSTLAEVDDPARLLELNAVIVKACHHDPRQRYATAQEMAADLTLLQHGKSVKRKRVLARRWKLAKNSALTTIALAAVVASARFDLQEVKRNRPLSSDPKAQKLYEQALYLLHSSTLDEQFNAFMKLTEAVERDPKFLEAHYMLFETYAGDLGDKLPPHTNQIANLRSVRDKLKALRPDSAQYHTVNSLIKFFEWHFNEAIDEAKHATELDQKLLRAHVLYGWYMLLVRRDAVTFRTEFKAAESIDGSDMIVQQHLGTPYYMEGNFPAAVERYRNALGVEPRAFGPHQFLGHIYANERHHDQALDEYEAADKLRSRNVAQTEATYKRYRSAFAENGPTAMWHAMLDELRQCLGC